MAELKLVLSNPKNGKSYQKEVKDEDAKALFGLKIGTKVKGEVIDLTGYEFEITGGSDKSGFPMRWDVQGMGRKKILAVSGTGLKKKRKGQKQRKTVCGNTVHEGIAQLNLKIIKEGKTPLDKPTEEPAATKKPAEAEKPAEKKQESKAEKPAEKKQEPKAEKPAEKKQELKAEKPAEKKQEPKAEKPGKKKENPKPKEAEE